MFYKYETSFIEIICVLLKKDQNISTSRASKTHVIFIREGAMINTNLHYTFIFEVNFLSSLTSVFLCDF